MRSFILLYPLVIVWLLSSPVVAQDTRDYSMLARPAIADKLSLSDEQRIAIARILDQRIADLVAAAPGERDQIVDRSNSDLEQLLSDEQKESFVAALVSGKLQFNFSQQKWSAVLDWFAKQAGLSLVMDSEPQGLFTYTDTNEYTPQEAIDLLNSVLLSKNFTLIRRDRMLMLVDTSDGIPFDLVPQIEIEQLADRGRFEIVTVSFPLGERPVATVIEEVTPLVGDHGRVTPMAAAKKLLVTETAGKLQAINVLIASIPEPKKPAPKPVVKPPAPVFMTYQAPGLDPTATIDTLMTLFPDAHVRFDPNAQVVHAQAIPATQDGIKSSLEKMIENASGDNEPRLKTYNVASERISELTTQIALVHPELQIAADPENSRLLVVADAGQHAALQQTLDDLGAINQQDAAAVRSVVVYEVDAPAIDPLVTLLQTILPRALVVSQDDRIVVRGTDAEQTLASSTIDQFKRDATRIPSLAFYSLKQPLGSEMLSLVTSIAPSATINQIDGGKKLSVLATPAEQQQIVDTLARIEETLTVQEPRRLKVYPVTTLQKSRLAMISEQLVETLGDMRVITDASPDDIAAWGTESQHTSLEQLLAQLKSDDRPMPSEPIRLKIGVAAPADVLAFLRQQFPDTQMVLNDQTSTLVVWGDEETHRDVRAAYEKLAAEMPARRETTLETYAVDGDESSTILQSIQAMVPRANVSIDDRAGRLVVTATQEEHQRIASIVEKLSTAIDTTAPVLIAYPLTKADAEAVTSLLSGVIPKWNVVADTRSNRVLVSAPLREQPRIQALIEQLDADPDPAGQQTVEAYPFKTLDPSSVIGLLQPLFPQMQLSVDAVNQQLVASGTMIEQQRLAAAIMRVDQREDLQPSRVESYHVGGASPDQVKNVLMQLAPSSVISSNPEDGTVLVWADDETHKLIAQAITQFTAAAPGAIRQLRIHPLPGGSASNVVSIVQQLAQSASVTLDESSQQLIVLANESDHQAIESALQALAASGPSDSDAVLRVHFADADIVQAAASTLSEVIPRARLVDSSEPDRMIIWANNDDHATMERLLRTLKDEIQAGRESRTIAVYEFKEIPSSTVQSMMTASLSRATVVDSNEHRIIVLADPADHAKLATMLQELRLAYQQQDVATLRKHAVRSDVRAQVISYLSNVMPDATVVDTGAIDSIAVWADEQNHTRIDEFISQFESELDAPSERITRVYPVDAKKMDVDSLLAILDSESTEGLSLQQNRETNSLVARGTAEQHERLRAAIEAVISQLPDGSQRQTTVYRFERGNPANAVSVLTSLIPEASIVADPDASVLVATATAEQHARIAAVVQQIELTEPLANQTTEIYRFDRASASTVQNAFAMLSPNARIGFDSGSNVVIATADPEAHLIFREAAALLDGQPKGSVVRVYPIDRDKLDIQTLIASVDQALLDDLAIRENAELNTLIARGSPEAQQQLKQAIDAIVTQLPDAVQHRSTQVYTLELADVAVVAQALESLAPNAIIAADLGSSSLLVTGDSEDHQRIAEVVDKLDVVPGQQPMVRVYPVRNGDAAGIFRSLSKAFEGNPDFSLTFQEPSKSIFVVATPRNHGIFSEMLEAMDLPRVSREPRPTRTYALRNIDAEVAASTMRAVMKGQIPAPEIQPDVASNALIVVANNRQQQLIRESLDQLDGDRRLLEVFQLQSADPFTIETAVNELFEDMPPAAAPSLSTDFGTNKLFARGSKDQIQQIRDLLIKLGESIATGDTAPGTGTTRVIPYAGDAPELIQQLQTIWPRVRKNRIHVMTPSRDGIRIELPGADPSNSSPDAQQPATGDEASNVQAAQHQRLVVFQDTTRNARAGDGESSTVADDQPRDSADESTDEPEPIMVVPGRESIIISSRDQEALGRMESIIRAMAAQGGAGSGSNFAVFLLRNTGANEIESVLRDLFRDLPMQRGGLGSAVLVADERLNAIIVHANSKTRQVIRELLEVLDSKELPDPLNVYRPEMIPLEFTQASRVLSILENVYKSQLTSGGGRQQVTIPEGVDAAVASVLQQINAAASGPVLTLDVDQASNSLIVRAPPELRAEIREFVTSIDQQAADQSSRQVRVIRLSETKSERMQSVLEQFLSEP